jgi:hypothetical protein
MKTLLTILAIAITLASCTNDETMENLAPTPMLGQVTFTYNGETISYSGENDPNTPETFNVYASTLQCYKTSATSAQNLFLDSGTSKGSHFVGITINAPNNQNLLLYAKNSSTKITAISTGTNNPKNLQITITEETEKYISGTFSANDINGTFTKIPKRNF